ncbi:AAA family ATPase [Neomicrococcus lactis]|uniref:Nuclease SbcCD subunit C n=1 Tax=Neomicrococcus lactis TaxID=732241 RepID=A0A7W8Y9J9_9MICC|nr:SMC family ATPase [Neomicrococcus lactis]MBB5597458.1 exonuclease SbcC [Neomicrococcus lactis]
MRIHRLELSAFGPFAGKEVIDFDALADAGLFLLNGETGAGKTSILDAVCFALYGSFPGARETMSKERVRSDHASDVPAAYQPTYVTCEFSVGNKRLRVQRTPAVKRPKLRGGGFTTDQAKTLLEEHREGSWVSLTNRNDEAGQQITSLLGLQRDQFTKLVMLPQGEFAAFLRSNANEKDAILRQLFDTRTFARAEDLLWQQYVQARDAISEDEIRLSADETRLLEAARNALDAWKKTRLSVGITDELPVPDETEAASLDFYAGQLETVEVTAKEWAKTLNSAYQEAQKIHEQRKEQFADASAHEAWQRRRQNVAEREGNVAALRVILDWDAKARSLIPAQQQRDAACTAQSVAEAKFEAARAQRAKSPVASAMYERYKGQLDEIVEDLAQQIAVLTERAKQEEVLLEKISKKRQASASLEALGQKIAELTKVRETVSATLPELQEQELSAQSGVLSVEAAQIKLTQAHDVLKAATQLDAVRTEVQRLATQWQSKSEATRSAQEFERQLTATAQQQVAARLALSLEDEQPCPVCGSADHPAPAVLVDGRIVTDEEREDAAARSEECRQAESSAEKALRSAQDRETQLAAHAREQSLEDATAAVSEAELAVKTAKGTVAALEVAKKKLQDAQQLLASTDMQLETTRVREESVAKEVETLTIEVAEITEEVAKDRGDYASISERVAEEKAARALLVAEMSSKSEADRALMDMAEAGRLWGERLHDAGFVDLGYGSEKKFLEALLDESVRAAHTGEVTSFTDEVSRIAELEGSAPVVRHKARVEAGESSITAEELEASSQTVNASLKLENIASKARIVLVNQREGFVSGVARNAKVREELEPRRLAMRELEGLAKVARGEGDNRLRMRLSSFVLAAKLEAVAAAATVRLHEMSDGRYQLIHVDDRQGRGKGGLDLAVLDSWTGQQRDTNSLSGGETFMVSLSLALGLAEVIQEESGGISLETLFVDEGFGTLDQSSLEQVMSAIDDLREGGRVVGLVSHVEEMKQRIPAQIQVRKTPRGSTTKVVLDGVA